MPAFPAPEDSQVWIDFDGTITQRDTLDDLIAQFAIDDSWKETEALWQAGEIGSRECLGREFALVRVSDEELEAFLDRIRIDPGVKPLLELLDRLKVPRAVLSDGIDHFIRRTLARFNVSAPIRSNTIDRDGRALSLRCLHYEEGCLVKAAHCKCGSMAALSTNSRKSIYIGDGRSDLCPARRADVVFAKGALAKSLMEEKRAFIPFETLIDVRDKLEEAWRHLSPSPGTPGEGRGEGL